MDNVSISQLVREIHAAPLRLVVAVTGGGSEAISQLLTTPGASQTVLEAVVPYSSEALVRFLAAEPEQYCGRHTSRAMAMAAYQRARSLSANHPLAGVSATASLASDRPKQGEHRVHAAIQTSAVTHGVSLVLTKDARNRREEESLVASLLLNLIAEVAEISSRVELSLLEGESIESRRAEASGEWQALLRGESQRVGIGPISATDQPVPYLFPGAFNPRHAGHREMIQIAERRYGERVAHELSIENVDKPPLDFLTIDERLSQFATDQFVTDEQIWLTRAATFVAKAHLFPGTTFLVGADTIERVVDPKYYGESPSAMLEAVESIRGSGGRFLVFGREGGGAFRSLSDLALPDSLLAICEEVPEAEFRDDSSSTELRQKDQAEE